MSPDLFVVFTQRGTGLTSSIRISQIDRIEGKIEGEEKFSRIYLFDGEGGPPHHESSDGVYEIAQRIRHEVQP